MSIKECQVKLDDGFYHVFVGEKEVGKYKTQKKALEKCDSTSGGIVLLDDGTVVYPEAVESETVVCADESAEPVEQPKKETLHGIVETRLNIRKSPSMDAEIVGTLRKEDPVNICEDLGGWYGIATASGERYVKAEFIEITKES